MVNPLFKKAIDGETALIPKDDVICAFDSEADLQAWCTSFGLQYEYVAPFQLYKIYKP